MRTPAVLLALGLAATSIAACGSSSPTVKATATKGDAFCVAALAAKKAGDAIDFTNATPDQLKTLLPAALAAGKAALALAPTDIAAQAKVRTATEEKAVTLFSKNGFDLAKVQADPTAQAVLDDKAGTDASTAVDAYLVDKCGATPDTTPTS